MKNDKQIAFTELRF